MIHSNFVLTVCFGALLVAPFAQADETTPAAIRLVGCRIKPAEQRTLSVNQSGVLDVIPREGDWVTAGNRVISLEDELPRATLAAAEREARNDVDIRYAESGSAVARLEYQQALEVNETVKGSVTITDVRRRKLELDQSLLQIEQAKYKQAIALLKRDEAAAQLKAYHMIAPISGTVNKVLKYKGEAVRQGEPVLELVNTRRVRVEGYLDVADRRRVTAGTPVEVSPEPRTGETADTPPTGVAPRSRVASLPGVIVFVDTVVQPVTQQVRVWADVENTDEVLLPGLTAVMTILPPQTAAVSNPASGNTSAAIPHR
jgi:multidrug resistance efflux pump